MRLWQNATLSYRLSASSMHTMLVFVFVFRIMFSLMIILVYVVPGILCASIAKVLLLFTTTFISTFASHISICLHSKRYMSPCWEHTERKRCPFRRRVWNLDLHYGRLRKTSKIYFLKYITKMGRFNKRVSPLSRINWSPFHVDYNKISIENRVWDRLEGHALRVTS